MADLRRIAAALRELAAGLEAETEGGGGGEAAGGAGGRCTHDGGNPGEAMLSAVAFGQRFDRSASWTKDLCRRGELEGAFRLPNGAWRIPAAAVGVYVAAQQAPDVVPLVPRRTGSISDWRKLKGAA